MAKRKNSGGDGGWALLGLLAAFVGIAYLTSGRGEDDSPQIPNELEGRIDFVVAILNQRFGHQWVTFGLDVLQAHLERAFPQVAALVNAVYSAEQAYRHIPKAGYAKKQAAVQMARGLRA